VTLQVQLLGAVVEEPGNLKCRVWARELMELLYPLAARSRIVAALLLQARCRVASFGGVGAELGALVRSVDHRLHPLPCGGWRRRPSLCSEMGSRPGAGARATPCWRLPNTHQILDKFLGKLGKTAAAMSAGAAGLCAPAVHPGRPPHAVAGYALLLLPSSYRVDLPVPKQIAICMLQ
jgi:hypothetical protein